MRMGSLHIRETRRRATNVSLPAEAVDEAKALGINVSRACEAGLLAELNRERKQRFQEENRAAIDSWNAWIEKNGLPLEELRLL
jgi:antitoxin CcdA